MEWSDAMTLSIVVGIPALVQTYMEPMETASSNQHVSILTYSPQGAPFVYSQTLIFRERPISDQPLLGMEWSDAMALFIVLGILDFAHIYMEPMETDSSKAAVSSSSQMLSSHKAISAQPLLGMKQSDAMALSIIVGIPDLAQIYMEPMETASSNLHVSGLTYSPQCAPFVYSQRR